MGRTRVEAELARYAEVTADAVPLKAVPQVIKARAERRDAIRRELKAVPPHRAGELDAGAIRATRAGDPADWTAMARQGVVEARRLLRKVLVDRIVFRPVPRPSEMPPPRGPGRKARLIYDFVGKASLSKPSQAFCKQVKFDGSPNGTRSKLQDTRA